MSELNPASPLSTPDNKPQAAIRDALRIPSAAILQGRRVVYIEHGDEVYQLRLTRTGKLLLQK